MWRWSDNWETLQICSCGHNKSADCSIHKRKQKHKYKNTQIHKYTNTQIHKYTNTQIHKYTISQIWSRGHNLSSHCSIHQQGYFCFSKLCLSIFLSYNTPMYRKCWFIEGSNSRKNLTHTKSSQHNQFKQEISVATIQWQVNTAASQKMMIHKRLQYRKQHETGEQNNKRTRQ